MTLGERIRTRRKELGLTLQDVADHSGSSKSYIWSVETDETLRPSANKISAIAKALDTTFDYIMNNSKGNVDLADEEFINEYLQLAKKSKNMIRRVVREMLR